MANQLISVIIVTYNSSLFVAETLESIYKQTWNDLELIITDDCSEDSTLEVCREWLIKNRERFVHAEIIASEKNTGVSANANRGLHAAKGEWIKFLGADDTLKPRCIEDNMSFITSNPKIKALFSRIELYRDTFEASTFVKTIPIDPFDQHSILALGRSPLSQYKLLLTSDRIHFTPSVFLHRETLISLGGYDERFPMLEDYPLWLKLTRNGHKLFFLDKVTVNYRQHSNAINNTGSSHLINPNYFENENFRRLCTYPFLPVDKRLEQRFTWFASQIFRFSRFNKNKQPFKLLHSLLITWLNPFRYFIRLRTFLNKDLKNNEFYM